MIDSKIELSRGLLRALRDFPQAPSAGVDLTFRFISDLWKFRTAICNTKYETELQERFDKFAKDTSSDSAFGLATEALLAEIKKARCAQHELPYEEPDELKHVRNYKKKQPARYRAQVEVIESFFESERSRAERFRSRNSRAGLSDSSLLNIPSDVAEFSRLLNLQSDANEAPSFYYRPFVRVAKYWCEQATALHSRLLLYQGIGCYALTLCPPDLFETEPSSESDQASAALSFTYVLFDCEIKRDAAYLLKAVADAADDLTVDLEPVVSTWHAQLPIGASSSTPSPAVARAGEEPVALAESEVGVPSDSTKFPYGPLVGMVQDVVAAVSPSDTRKRHQPRALDPKVKSKLIRYEKRSKNEIAVYFNRKDYLRECEGRFAQIVAKRLSTEKNTMPSATSS